MTGIKRRFDVISDVDERLLLKVAFASDNNKLVNQHFGSAKSFFVYGINPESARLLSVAEFSLSEGLDNEDKLIHKLASLDDCIAVYCKACGASAVKQLLERGVQPLKVIDDTPINDLIKYFQQELNSGPSSWLATAIKRQKDVDCRNFGCEF